MAITIDIGKGPMHTPEGLVYSFTLHDTNGGSGAFLRGMATLPNIVEFAAVKAHLYFKNQDEMRTFEAYLRATGNQEAVKLWELRAHGDNPQFTLLTRRVA